MFPGTKIEETLNTRQSTNNLRLPFRRSILRGTLKSSLGFSSNFEEEAP